MKHERHSSSSLSLTTASLFGSLLSLVRLITGLIRIKVIAIILGTEGVGLISQSNEFWLMIVSACSLMMAPSLISQLKKAETKEQRVQLVKTTLTLQSLLIFMGLSLILGFAPYISKYLFKTESHSKLVVLLTLSIPFTVWASSTLQAILYAFSNYTYFILVSCVAAIASTTVICLGVWFKGIEWVFYGWLVSGLLLTIGAGYRAKKFVPLKSFWPTRLNRQAVKLLLPQSLTLFTASIFQNFLMIQIRSHIIGSLGVNMLGLIQVPIALTAYSSPFLTNQLWGHFHPLISRADGEERDQALIKTLTWTMALQFSFALGMIGYGKLFIHLVYTKKFLPALNYFWPYIIGNCLYFFSLVGGIYFIAKLKSQIYLLGMIIYFSTWYAFQALMIKHLGLMAVPYGHLLGSGLVAFFFLAWLLKTISASKIRSFLLFLLPSVATLVLQYQLQNMESLLWISYVLPPLYFVSILLLHFKTAKM